MINFHIDDRLFQSEILYFQVMADDARADVLKSDMRLQYSFGEYYVTSKEPEITDEGLNIISFEAEAGWMRLADRKKIGDFEVSATPADGLALILANTGWNVSSWMTTDATAFYLLDTDKSVLEWIWNWARVTGNEVAFDSLNHEVSLVPQVGIDLGLSFRYAKNIQGIRRTEIPPTTTRLYPFGKDDLDVSTVTSGGVPYIEDFSYYIAQGLTEEEARAGYLKEETIVDTSFTDVNALYNWGVSRLAITAQPQITYTANVVDLTTLVDHNEGGFQPGDSVWVEAAPIKVSERARVIRRDWYPYEPDRDIIELAFNPVIIPNNTSANGRGDQSASWELFESRNTSTPRQVRLGHTVLHRLALRTTSKAEWALHYNVEGVGVGSGTLTIEVVDDETGQTIWPTQTFTITNGARFNWQFSYGQNVIPITPGDHALTIRAWSSGSGVGINIPAMQTAFWVLARGTVRQNFTLDNSIRYDFVPDNGAVQYFVAPDDVFEILAEFHGSGLNAGAGVGGGLVKAKFPVVPGLVYEVYIAGGTIGYPNGGTFGAAGPFGASNGNGSSSMRLSGNTFAQSMIIAAGAGGAGEGSASNPSPFGGYGGFYAGGDAQHAKGASDIAGGDGLGGGEAGDTDGLGEGGDASGSGNAFDFAGGGGGGGAHGGEGGQATGAPNQSGGGGGSGAIDATGYDLEIMDNENAGNGYAIISWESPVE